MTVTLHLAVVVGLATMLLVSATGKARDLPGSVETVGQLSGLPVQWAGVVTRLLIAAELLIVAGLLLSDGTLFTLTAVATCGLMLAFSVVVGRALAQDQRVPCHCFGASAEPLSRATLARNLFLVAAATGLFAVSPFPGVWATATTLDPVRLMLLLGLFVAAGVLVRLWGERSRLRHEVDRLAAELTLMQARPAAGQVPTIPEVIVRGLDDEVEHPLRSLSLERAQLMLAVAPGCSACTHVAAAVPHWAHALHAELDVVLLSAGEAAATRASYAELGVPIYLDAHRSAMSALGLGGTPAAVLLGSNGTVAAGPALGLEAIIELITAIIQAIGVNVMTGRAHQAQGPRPLGGADSGSDHLPPEGFVPADFDVRTEDGDLVSFRDAVRRFAPPGSSIPVLAWRNGCRYCEEILPPLREHSARGEVILLVNESVSSVRQQGLMGPALQTVQIDNCAALGLPGTPAGYPVLDGALQAGGGVGGGSVLRMVREHVPTSAAATPTGP